METKRPFSAKYLFDTDVQADAYIRVSPLDDMLQTVF